MVRMMSPRSPAKHVLDPLGETPMAGDDLVGETELFQFCRRPVRSDW